MQHDNSPVAFKNDMWTPAFITDEEYSEHSAAMLTRAVSLAYGDAAILHALLEAAKAGQFPLGPFGMPDIPKAAIYRLSVTRVFYTLMGYHSVPIRARSLEEAMQTLGMADLGIDALKLSPDSLKQVITNSEAPGLDRIHAWYGHLCFLWISQGGKEASSDDVSADAFAICRRVATVLELPEISQPKSQADRRRKITDSILLSSFVAGITDPAALVCLFVPRMRNPAVATTTSDEFGGPAGLTTCLPLKTLAARFPEELRLDGKLQDRLAAGKLFVSGTADNKWMAEAIRLLRDNGVEPLFIAPTSSAKVAALLTRLESIGLVGHIGARNAGFSGSYTVNVSSEVYLLNLMRSLLSEHPDLFPGATRAASLRRVATSSMSDRTVMRIAAGRLDSESKLALAYEATQTSAAATNTQFANYLVWKAKAEVNAIATPGSVQFSPTHSGVVFITAVGGLNDPKYVVPGTTNPNTTIGTEALIVSSVETWKAGINTLVQKHQASITRDLTQDSRRADKRRLAITDLDPSDPINASGRTRVADEAE